MNKALIKMVSNCKTFKLKKFLQIKILNQDKTCNKLFPFRIKN